MLRLLKLSTLCLLISLTFYTQAFAFDPYFGFKLGQQTFDDIRKDFRERGAQFRDNISYQDYESLRSIQVVKHSKFSLEGDFRFATLDFDPNGYLYQVTISWKDDNSLFTKWKNILDNANYFTVKECTKQGFSQTCFWKNSLVNFSLTYDPSGFGKNSNTTLTFNYPPSMPLVETEKKRIDKEVEKAKIVEQFKRFQ